MLLFKVFTSYTLVSTSVKCPDNNFEWDPQISKNKRHQDRAAALEVWDRLEQFMQSRSHV